MRSPAARRPASQSRASPGSARRASCASCAIAPRIAGISPSLGRLRSSSATCRSACGPMRWTPTSRRSSSDLDDAADLAEILPSLRTPGASGSSVADERYRAHRAVRALLDLLADERAARARLRRPSLERCGIDRADRGPAATRPGRAGPAGTRLPARTGPRAARRRACRAGRAAHHARAAERERRRRTGRPSRRRARSIGTPAATRSTSSSWRASRPVKTRPMRPRPAAVPAAVMASLAEELGSLDELERSPAQRRRRCGRAVRTRPRGRSRRALARTRDSRRSTRCWRADLLRPTTVPRRFSVPPSARAPRGVRLGAGRLAAARPRPRRERAGGARRGADRARAPCRAIRSTRRRAGDRATHRSRGRRGAARARGRRRAGSRRHCACCPSADNERRVDVLVSLASAQRSLELERCRDDAARARWSCCRRTPEPARRAHRALRSGRALAGTPRRCASASRPSVG